ncbi:twin-arginine translocation signal domain-containing protein [Salinigranum marinum]|uniref:twin-arginine translocation signal domain-containing protein n=1 Tax=Salinigranum marinum TaxID=1515595 RepID=UPI00298A04A0|nr:twin-arginine translocation signal domain-containing protein [Salinigranum marinum]
MPDENSERAKKQSVNRREFVKLSSVAVATLGTGMAGVAAGSDSGGSIHTTDFSEWVQ